MVAFFARFHILGPIGRGGSSVVHAALLDGRPVALKVLRGELGDSPRERERFSREVELLRKVDHPAVVRLVDAGILDDGRPWIAMERHAGETLATRLARGPLPLSTAMARADELAAGLDALHAIGLTHRDVKPENVWLTEAPERALLLDLGIARERGEGPSTTTVQGRVRGTPAYMAPERFFGSPATVASDVYELAVVTFAMIAGRLPWDAHDPEARLAPRPLRQLVANAPASLERALAKALSTRPEARPASASAFAASLREPTVETQDHVTESLPAMRDDRARPDARETPRDVRAWPAAHRATLFALVGIAIAAASIALTMRAHALRHVVLTIGALPAPIVASAASTPGTLATPPTESSPLPILSVASASDTTAAAPRTQPRWRAPTTTVPPASASTPSAPQADVSAYLQSPSCAALLAIYCDPALVKRQERARMPVSSCASYRSSLERSARVSGEPVSALDGTCMRLLPAARDIYRSEVGRPFEAPAKPSTTP